MRKPKRGLYTNGKTVVLMWHGWKSYEPGAAYRQVHPRITDTRVCSYAAFASRYPYRVRGVVLEKGE
jgi:hypothetical protein